MFIHLSMCGSISRAAVLRRNALTLAPPLILAVNGLADKPLLPMIGQLAMQGLLVKEVGSPQVTAVDDSPCVADRSRFRAVEWREVDRD